jgi:hypothetical protein
MDEEVKQQEVKPLSLTALYRLITELQGELQSLKAVTDEQSLTVEELDEKWNQKIKDIIGE